MSHNVLISKLSKMEEECEKDQASSTKSLEMKDLCELLTTFSTQMASQIDGLQVQLTMNDTRISQEQERFKQEIHNEIDQLRQIVLSQTTSGPSEISSPDIKVPVTSLPVSSSMASTSSNAVLVME